MSTNFPGALDALTNPTATDTVAGVDHASQHSNVNDAIEAIQAKLGADSSAVTTSHDYKLSEVTSSDKAVGKTATQTLTNKTLTSPVFTTPQINDTSLDHQYVFAVSELSADRTVTLPLLTTADEFVFKDHAVTLTNKTMDGDVNTFTDLAANTVFKSGTAVPIANGGSGQTSKTNAFDALSPTTTKGDIIASDGSDNVRLGVGSNNQILIADSSQTTGLRWADATSTGMAKIVVSATEITVGNTTTETTLFSTSVAGGTLSTNNALYFKIYLSDFDFTNANNLTVRAKYGGTTVATAVVATDAGSAAQTNSKGYIEGYVIADGSASVQKGTVTFNTNGSTVETGSDATVRLKKAAAAGEGTGAVDSSTSQTLLVSVQWAGAAAADTLTAEWWIVEKIA